MFSEQGCSSLSVLQIHATRRGGDVSIVQESVAFDGVLTLTVMKTDKLYYLKKTV